VAGVGAPNQIIVPADVSQVEIRVLNAEGKTSLREKLPPVDRNATQPLLWRLPVAALSPGDNRVVLYVRDGNEPLAPAFVVEFRK
jgi:hypothetical protein